MAEVVATTCPACGALVELETVAVGLELECLECHALLEVMSEEPLELVETEEPDVVPFPEEDEYGVA